MDFAGIHNLALELDGQPLDPAYLTALQDVAQIESTVDREGRLTGWGAVADTPFGSLLTDLFVSPAHQGQGLGSTILRRLWTDDRPRFTFASHHPAALPLYIRAGMTPAWPLLYLTGDPSALPSSPARCTVVPVEEAAAAEQAHTGLDRTRVYAYWAGRPEARPLLVHLGRRLIAAGVADPSGVPHLCVLSDADAAPATAAALHACGSPGSASLCLPGPHPLVPELLRSRFRITDSDIHLSSVPGSVPVTWVLHPGLA